MKTESEARRAGISILRTDESAGRKGAGGRVLRASEIGEYIYCHRAWWLHRVLDWESANRTQMAVGIARHVEHGQAVQRAANLYRAALVLMAGALLVSAAGLLALFFLH